MRALAILILYCATIAATTVRGQQQLESVVENPAHEELRAVRDGFVDAFKQKDMDKMLTHLHEDVVITYQNAEVSRGHGDVRDFHNRMSEGDDREVISLQSEFKVDELSILYGDDAAIAFGDIHSDFELASGMNFHLHSRWTATLVKQEGRWLIAALHASTSMFDNGVSNLMIKWNSIKAGAIALAVGLVLGIAGAKVIGGKRTPKA